MLFIIAVTFMIVYAIALICKYGKPKPKPKATTKVDHITVTIKESNIAATQAEKAKAQETKKIQEKQLAESDREFYQNQLDRLYSLLWDADTELNKAKETIEHDRELNKYGAVIGNKQLRKHFAEYEKQQKRVLALETRIHNTEKRLNKAQYIIDD